MCGAQGGGSSYEDKIRKWQESVAQRRKELFGPGSRRKMIPAGHNRKVGRYEEQVEVEDVFGSADLK